MARRLKSGWGSDRYGWFGSSGDTESEVHSVCVGEVIMYGRRMQACGLVRVSVEARVADACRQEGEGPRCMLASARVVSGEVARRSQVRVARLACVRMKASGARRAKESRMVKKETQEREGG